ncbi:MAG: hypothetical protein FWC23_05105 [Chitinispirillia bacterium]|nr:hypothetical protein [Chitinispirillia bacterium]MCL2268546.1 hypothetical protein [Chitinispirillia bacterium]
MKKNYIFFLLIPLLSCDGDIKNTLSNAIVNLVMAVLNFVTMIVMAVVPPETPKYGVEFNEEREKIGLHILDSNWRYSRSYGEMYDESGRRVFAGNWINIARTHDKPHYAVKSFEYTNDTIRNTDVIISETDLYIGSREYTTIDGTFKEELYITYFFSESRWRYSLCGEDVPDLEKTAYLIDGKRITNPKKAYSSFKSFILTKEEADSVLKDWNIDRK